MAILKTVVGGSYRASERDILIVRFMLNEIRSRRGLVLLSKRAVVDAELLQAIEEFQKRHAIGGKIEVAQGDATYNALHSELNSESYNDNQYWEKAGADELKGMIEMQWAWERANQHTPSRIEISWPARETAFAALSAAGGIVTVGERLAIAGVSVARQLRNVVAWCEVALRVGARRSWIIKQLPKMLLNPSSSAAFMKVFESGERAIAIVTKLKKIEKIAARWAVLLSLPQFLYYLYQGQYGQAFGHAARVFYSIALPAVAIFEAFEAIMVWKWEWLKNNFCWQLLTCLNPGRHIQILVDLKITICHVAFEAYTRDWASVNAVLNDFASRWEDDPLNIFTETFGIALAVFTKWFAEQMADLFNTTPPDWAYYLLDYYKTKIADKRAASPEALVLPTGVVVA